MAKIPAKKKVTPKKPAANGKPKTEKVMTAREIITMATDLSRRTGYAAQMGLSYDGERDLYAALGYSRTILWSEYEGSYKRDALSKRIINAFPNATWRGIPTLKGNETLNDEWEKLQKELRIVNYFTRADRLAGIGRYSVLLLGFQDGKNLDEEVKYKKGMQLAYLSPFSEINAQLEESDLIDDAKNARYGQPKMYNVKLSVNQPSQKVHWTRILHVSEGLSQDEIYGTPRLECVWNRLQDVEKIAGGSGEMFWRGAFPGYAFLRDPEAEIGTQTLTEMQDEVEDFIHSLSRYMRLQGMQVQELKPQVANPDRHMMSQLKLISGGTGIPLRILIGSERGELASSEDRKSWHERVYERQLDFGELVVVRPFVDRLMTAGVLAKSEYTVEWPPLNKLTEKEAIEIGVQKTKALTEYVSKDGDMVVDVLTFLTTIIGFDEQQATEIMKVLEANLDEEEDDVRKAAEESTDEEE